MYCIPLFSKEKQIEYRVLHEMSGLCYGNKNAFYVSVVMKFKNKNL